MAPVTRQCHRRAERRRRTRGHLVIDLTNDDTYAHRHSERRRKTRDQLRNGTILVIDLTNDGTHAQHEAVAPEVTGPTAGTPRAATPEVTGPTAGTPRAATPELTGLTPRAATPRAAAPELINLTAGTPEATSPDTTDLTADTPRPTKSTAWILDLSNDDSCYMKDDGIDFHSILGAALGSCGYPAQDEVGDQEEMWGFVNLDPFVASMFTE